MHVPRPSLAIALSAIVAVASIASAIGAEKPAQSCEELTADWPLWSALSRHPWSAQEIAERRYFPLEQVLEAVRLVPLSAPLPPDIGRVTGYAEAAAGDRPGRVAYLAAAEAYGKDDFAQAIPLFDAIAADKASTFRAAAAYSAARAAIQASDLEDAARRIDALLRDPTLGEFHRNAHDLLSTMRYDYEAAALNAAELAEISHMLAAPTAAICDDRIGETLRRKFDAEYPGLIASDVAVRHVASSAMAQIDPVIAAAGAVSAGRFGKGELAWSPDSPWRGRIETPAIARRNWRTTGNPLWAVALLEDSDDAADLRQLPAAIAALRRWPGLSQAAQARYAWRLVAQEVRILLVRGMLDKAAAAARRLTAADFAQAGRAQIQSDIAATTEAIIGSGIRWFLRKNDYRSARRWALLGSQAFGLAVPSEMKPVLARDFDELYGTGALSLDRVGGTAELGNARIVLDLFPARFLIGLSRRPAVAAADQRAMVGAAWTRAYALSRWRDVIAWLPALRRAFPELSADIRPIEMAGSRRMKQHLATRLLLKAPGLIALPSWARPPGGPERWSSVGVDRPSDVRLFDRENPNDGNWWCEADAERIKVDAAVNLVESAVDRSWFAGASPNFPLPDEWYGSPALRLALLNRAGSILANYPLLKGADLKELHLLAKAGSASKRLAAEATQWAGETTTAARQAARDALLPETLSLAVRATRYGCQRGVNNGAWSHAAFVALHELYPTSPWTQRTPYWFGRPIPPEPVGTPLDRQGLQKGIIVDHPARLTTCPGKPELLFLSAPRACDDDSGAAAGRGVSSVPSLLVSFMKNDVAVGRGRGLRPPRNNTELTSVYCRKPFAPMPPGITFLGKPAGGCRYDHGGGVEIRAMSLFTGLGDLREGEVLSQQDAPRSAVVFDLKTTRRRLAGDLATLRHMTNSARACIQDYIHPAPTQKLGLEACPK